MTNKTPESPKIIQLLGRKFLFDLEGEQWPDMFHDLDHGRWEASTLGFVVAQSKPGVTFVDIGAASGIFSIFAAAGGASVIAFEPHKGRYVRLNLNAKLNKCKIDARRQALTNFNSRGSEDLDRTVLSRNVHDSDHTVQASATRFRDFLEESKDESRLVLKCDIEGAEYRLFSDSEAVSLLGKRKTTLLLSVHPGFNRDRGFDSGIMKLLHGGYKRMISIFDNQLLYRRLNSFTCRMVNGTPIKSGFQFQRLIWAGMRDFIFESTSKP